MSFDIQHEIAQVFKHQRAFLCSSGDETALLYGTLSDALYQLIDQCSEADFHGVADALALYGELLSQVCSEEQYPSDQPVLDLMMRAAGCFNDLSEQRDNTVAQLTRMLEDNIWPEPVPTDDTLFLAEILAADLPRLCPADHALTDDGEIELTETQLITPESTVNHADEIELDEIVWDAVVLDSDALDSGVSKNLPLTESDPLGLQVSPVAELKTEEQQSIEPLLTAPTPAQHAADQLSQSVSAPERTELMHTLVDQFSEDEFSGLADSCALAAELFEQSPDDTHLHQQLSDALGLLFSTSAHDCIQPLLSIMIDSRWPEPVPADDTEFLQSLLEEDCQRLTSLSAESNTDTEEAITTETSHAVVTQTIDPPLRNLPKQATASLAAEFCEINFSLLEEEGPNIDPAVLQMLTQSLGNLISRWQQQDVASDKTLLNDTTDALIPICRALDTLHLRGIHTLLGGLEINLGLLQHLTPTQQSYEQFAQCLQTVQEHLNEIENAEIQRTLIDLCSSPSLPCPLNEDQAAFLSGMLALASVQTIKDIVKQTAAPDDIVVDIQDDLDPNLLDMLVVELPSLTEEFLTHLQAVIDSGSLADLDAARRTAHTIKGLGNMAGIQGLANLTHGLEDILDMLVDTQSLPGRKLKDDLQEAADCLAAMGESVTDKVSPPPNALSVLQVIMDWSYLLKTEGVEAAASALPDRPADEAAPVQASPPVEETKVAAAVTPERKEDSFLRVQQSLLDNLFRITGESNTLTSQQNESITQLRTMTRVNRERQRNLQRIIFELEQQLNEYYTLHPELDPETVGFDPLEMDNYNEMHTSLSRLHESAADVREVEQEMDQKIRHLTDLHVAQSSLQKENLATILNTRLVTVKSITSRVQRIMRQACRSAEKKATLIIEGEDTLVDSQILTQLTDPLMHIIRNAVDHGLETPQQRLAAGKPEEGTLTLRFHQENEEIRVSCEDDGNGIDTNKIRAVAAAKGLVEEHAILSETELQRIILLPGFSTREEVSQLSGRGIGMDVVYQQIMRMQGTLNIESSHGQGTRFDLTMPSSSLMIRALLVRASRQLIALSSHGIEQSVLSLDGQLLETEEGSRFIYGEEEYPALTLETLLSEPRKEYGNDLIHPVLIINLGQGDKVALMVKEVIAHRELVFKEMGEYVPDIPGIPGVTILANGEAAPIVDLPARILHQRASHIEYSELLEQDVLPDLPKLMVVDDSISARKSLETLLKDTGYEVSTAIDGLDALNKIRKDPPDLVLTDLEMPRMSGIELSSAIRNNDITREIPVIMITSRSTDKHRDEAATAGVTDYLTKPWTEEGLLSRVQNMLS